MLRNPRTKKTNKQSIVTQKSVYSQLNILQGVRRKTLTTKFDQLSQQVHKIYRND